LSRVVLGEGYLKMVLTKLEEARESVDELIDTLEMLLDAEFQTELWESLKEAERGEVKEFKGLSELRKETSSG